MNRREAVKILAKDWLGKTIDVEDCKVQTPAISTISNAEGDKVTVEFLLPVSLTLKWRKKNLMDFARIKAGHIQTRKDGD